MAKKRKFCAYRRLERPYTRRSKFRSKSFVRATPQTKIVRFDMGNKSKKDWDFTVDLISKGDLNIRDNAVESSRQLINKFFETKLGTENYHFRIKAYPHHMLRENPLASGAGADRMSTGMKMSFGKVVGIAARVNRGKAIFSVHCNKENVAKVTEGMAKANSKLPGNYSVQVKPYKKRKVVEATA